jgi:hypothetical protein
VYPRADLDMVGEGFMVTCSDEEALKLIEDSAMTAGQIVDMLGVDMSLGTNRRYVRSRHVPVLYSV